MLKRIVVLLSLFGSTFVLPPSQAAAVDRCPTLHVAAGDACICFVTNYGTGVDTNVTITIVRPTGAAPVVCGPTDIAPGIGAFCGLTATSFEHCGCVVTGEGAASRTSLSTADSLGATSLAAVDCR